MSLKQTETGISEMHWGDKGSPYCFAAGGMSGRREFGLVDDDDLKGYDLTEIRLPGLQTVATVTAPGISRHLEKSISVSHAS